MDFNSISVCAVYTAKGREFTTRELKNEHFEISARVCGDCFYAGINPKTAVSFKKLRFELPYGYSQTDRIFVNGYQSWTDSLEYSVGESMGELTRLTEFCITNRAAKLCATLWILSVSAAQTS